MRSQHTRFLQLLMPCAIALIANPLARADDLGSSVKPDVAAVLKSAENAYMKFSAYSHSETLTVHNPASKQNPTITTKLAFKRPNLINITTQSGPDLVISDGTNLYIYRQAVHEYTKDSAPASLVHADEVLGRIPNNLIVTQLVFLMLHNDLGRATNFLSLATLQKPTTYHGALSDDLLISSGDTSIHLYFNKKTHLLEGAFWKSNKASLTEELSDIKTNDAVPATLFAFSPPNDAKLVAELDDPEELELRQKYVDKPAVDFSLKDTLGKTWDLADLKGKVVVVDFWASWCGPCQMVMPTLEKIHEQYADKGVVVLAVNTWDKLEDCQKFLKNHPEYKMNVLLNQTGSPDDSVATKLYGVHGIPTTLFIDKDGIVRTYAIGAHPPEFYFDQLKKLGVDVSEK